MGQEVMQEHIIGMSDIIATLKTLGMTVGDSFLVQFIVNSLPPKYGPFQINYNTIKDKWNNSDLASKLVHEETRLRSQGIHSISTMRQKVSKGKLKANKFKKWKTSSNNLKQQIIMTYYKKVETIRKIAIHIKLR